MADQMNARYVTCVVIEDTLSCEIVKARSFWRKLEANQMKTFTVYQADLWVSLKSL